MHGARRAAYAAGIRPSPYVGVIGDDASGHAMTSAQFAGLYTTHHEAIERWITHKSGSWTTAQDVTSRAFMVAWEHRAECRSNPKSWLYSIAMRELLQHWRRERPMVNIDDCPDLPDSSDPAREFFENENSKVARALLKKLASVQRDALMARINGDSLTEISRKLGVPLGTTGRRLFDARNEMKERLCEIEMSI